MCRLRSATQLLAPARTCSAAARQWRQGLRLARSPAALAVLSSPPTCSSCTRAQHLLKQSSSRSAGREAQPGYRGAACMPADAGRAL